MNVKRRLGRAQQHWLIGVVLTLVLTQLACGRDNLGFGDRATVTSVEPQGLVRRTEPIVVRFSKAADEDRVGRPLELEAAALIHPRIRAVATFTDPKTLKIEPLHPYQPATRYRLALRPDLLGLGQPLSGRRTFDFRTPALGLEEVRGWRTQAGLELALRFSHPVSIPEAEAAITVALPDETLLPIELLEGAGPRVSGPVRRLNVRVKLGEHSLDRAPRSEQTRQIEDRAQLATTLASVDGASELDVPSMTSPEEVILRVDEGLASALGGGPLGKSVIRRVTIEQEVPIVDKVRPVQLGARWAVAIDLASEVPPSRLVGAVRGAGPSVSMALSPDGPWILGAFSPETTASLQIGPPLLEQPSAWVLELPRLEPALRILNAQPLLDLPPGARLEVEHHEVQGLMLTARVVPPELVGLVVDRLVPAQPLPEVWSGPTLGPILREAELDGRTPLDPSSLLDGLPPGLVLIEVRDEQRPWLRDIRYLNRRGLELVLKRRSGYVWARVQDLQGAVAKATVRVLGVGGQVLATARTNSLGVTSLSWSEGTGALAIAEAEDRYAVLPLAGPVAVRGTDKPPMQANMVPNRVVLAPGQDVDVSVLLSDTQRRPIAAKLQLVLQRPRGARIAKTKIRVAANGAGQGKLTLSDTLETGPYQLKLEDPQGVELAKARLEVRRRRLREARVVVKAAPQPLAFEVSTDGLARSERVHGLCHYQREDNFADLPAPVEAAPRVEPIAVDLGRGDRRVVRCPAPPTADRPWRVRLEAHTRYAASGEAVRIHAPNERYVAIEPPRDPPQAGQPLAATVRVVDRRGRPVEGSIDVDIRYLEPRSGRIVQPGGRLTLASLSVEAKPENLTLALVDGAAVIPFVPARGGPWSVRVLNMSRTLWVAGSPGTLRPLELVLHRTRRGVRAALPFPGRLLLTEDAHEVGRYRATLETAVTSEHRIGYRGAGVTGLLLGTEGRWSKAVLPPSTPPPQKTAIQLKIDGELKPNMPAQVWVEAGPSAGGVFRVLVVDASSAPDAEQLRRWMTVHPQKSALDTLVTAAFDDSAPPAYQPDEPPLPGTVGLRPGRSALATPWLALAPSGRGRARLTWPNSAGRVRIIALVRNGDQLGVGSTERVIGDGLGLDIALPSALRSGDRLSVPILLENGAPGPINAQVKLSGDGFKAIKEPKAVTLNPGEFRELRVSAGARPDGPLEAVVGNTTVTRAVERIRDEAPRWRGRAATASARTAAILPTPEQLGATGATLVVGPSSVLRFSAALKGLLSAPPLDGEQAAATVLAASVLPEVTKALGGIKAYRRALARIPAALEDADLWVRALAGHAAIEAGRTAGAARRALADVAASSSNPEAAAYAKLLLARAGRAAQGEALRRSGRADAVAFAVATDVLLKRLSVDDQAEISLVPFAGPRKGRMGPTIVNALALFALESAGLDLPASSLLEAAITSAARTSRWTHPAEEALALAALSLRAQREKSRPYWGTLLLDGKHEQFIKSKELLVLDLNERLSQRPEVSVKGPGTAEVALVLAGRADSVPSDALRIQVRRLNSLGEELVGPVLEGRLMSIVVDVENLSPEPERVVIDVPIPAGLEVETEPSRAVSRQGGYTLVVDLPAQGQWTGRFEARARYAGVWQAPPVKVRLRYGRAEASAPQDELWVDAGGTPGQ